MKHDEQRYKVYSQKHWAMIHWKINPGLAFNELILGQRVPKISLVDKTKEVPLSERSYVPCPNCHILHDSRTWSRKNGTAFKNWYGLYCNSCHTIIPCIRNVWSQILLWITYPVRILFFKNHKHKWLAAQPDRYRNIDTDTTLDIYKANNWIKIGLYWGAFMFAFMMAYYYLFTDQKMNIAFMIFNFIGWVVVGGLAFGYFLKRYLSRKGGSKEVLEN